MEYHIGMIVEHPNRPDWGPGKVLDIEGNTITVYFRDIEENKPREAHKDFYLNNTLLKKADKQSDPFLDNLPKYDRNNPRQTIRLTLVGGIRKFRAKFPGGFKDPVYLTDLHHGERKYKWDAHLLFEELLNIETYSDLLKKKEIQELTRRALSVESKVNLLSPFEKMALHDALKQEKEAETYFEALHDLLISSPSVEVFEKYFKAVENLPAEENKAHVATWPVATILPYLAQPQKFMFLKPEPTQACASRINFNLQYLSKPNWLTYKKLLEMCSVLMENLRPLGAQDMIDIQSFIWCIAGE